MPTPTEDEAEALYRIVTRADIQDTASIRLEDINTLWQQMSRPTSNPPPTAWRISDPPAYYPPTTSRRYRVVWRDHITNRLDHLFSSCTLDEAERKVREYSEMYVDKTFWYEEVT